MTALEYFRQPMKYQTFLGGGLASEADTMKLLSVLEKQKEKFRRAERFRLKKLRGICKQAKRVADSQTKVEISTEH